LSFKPGETSTPSADGLPTASKRWAIKAEGKEKIIRTTASPYSISSVVTIEKGRKSHQQNELPETHLVNRGFDMTEEETGQDV